MEKNKEYDNKVKALKQRIQKLLAAKEEYSPEFTYQVEITASVLIIFRDVARQVYGKKVSLMEKSREGNDRSIKNPDYDTYCMVAKAAQASLKSLMMNKEVRHDKKASDNEETDALTKLMEGLKED